MDIQAIIDELAQPNQHRIVTDMQSDRNPAFIDPLHHLGPVRVTRRQAVQTEPHGRLFTPKEIPTGWDTPIGYYLARTSGS